MTPDFLPASPEGDKTGQELCIFGNQMSNLLGLGCAMEVNCSVWSIWFYNAHETAVALAGPKWPEGPS